MIDIPQDRPPTDEEVLAALGLTVPAYHQVVFAGEYGFSVGSYHVTDAKEALAMRMRYDMGTNIATCIAAFWYVNGTTHRFTFNRA